MGDATPSAAGDAGEKQPPPDMLLRVHKFLGTSMGRDKVAKTVHYGSRGLAGVCAIFGHEFLRLKFRSLFVTVMEARRCNRWLTSTGVLLALRKPECPWGEENRVWFVASQISMMMWHLVDHVRWLQKASWLPGDEARSRRLSFLFFGLGSALACTNTIRKLVRAKDTTTDEVAKTRLECVKHAATVVACAHISDLFKTHETICGFSGMVASMVDIYHLFPRR